MFVDAGVTDIQKMSVTPLIVTLRDNRSVVVTVRCTM